MLKDPLNRFIKNDPKAAFLELLKKDYSKTFDIKTVKIAKVEKDQNAAVAGVPGTPAAPATPPTAVPGGQAIPGTPATPALSGTPGTPATNVSGRTIITFTANLLITTGGSSPTAEYTAVLSRNNTKDPNNMFSMRVFDDKKHEISGAKNYTPIFDKILNTFVTKNPNTRAKTDGTVTRQEAIKLLDMVYTVNNKIFNSTEQAKFNILSNAVINIADIKKALTKLLLVEKIYISQKVLLEQLNKLKR